MSKPRDWQVQTILPNGWIDVDCNSGETRHVLREEIEARHAGEYRDEDFPDAPNHEGGGGGGSENLPAALEKYNDPSSATRGENL